MIQSLGMSTSNKCVIRPNLGSTLRPRGKTPRKHFLTVDVTKAEQQAILNHCLQNKISLSQFLADLILEDVAKLQPGAKQRVLIKAQFKLAQPEYEKLALPAQLHKTNISDLIHELLMPNLDQDPTSRSKPWPYAITYRRRNTNWSPNLSPAKDFQRATM